MKIIISRKGFDWANGGIPSPVMPDGTMLSLPIPSWDDMRFGDLLFDGNTYQDIIYQLKKGWTQNSVGCHLDPDIRNLRPELSDWWPAFGQGGAAETHLENQGVQVGDLFLFFGWFRETEYKNGKLKYCTGSPDVHMIYGYLQIGEIVQGEECLRFPWHPHSYHCGDNNTIYAASEHLCIDGVDTGLPGAGVLKYSEQVILTKKGESRSRWDLPDFFKKVSISHHSAKSFENGYFQSVKIGQEFVVSESKDVNEWARSIIVNNFDEKERLHYMSEEKLINVQELAYLVGCSIQTLNSYYKFKDEQPEDEYAKMLPEYVRQGNKNTRYWKKSDVDAIIKFRKNIPQGRNGALGCVTQKYVNSSKKENKDETVIQKKENDCLNTVDIENTIEKKESSKKNLKKTNPKLVTVNYEATGKLIMKTCEEAGYTAKDLCALLDLETTAPYAWFNGKSLPKIIMFVKLASLLGCTVDDLLVIEEEKNPKIWRAYGIGSHNGKTFNKWIDFEPAKDSVLSYESEIADIENNRGMITDTSIYSDAYDEIAARLLADDGCKSNDEVPQKENYNSEEDYYKELKNYIYSDDTFLDNYTIDEIHVEDKGLTTRLKKRYKGKDFSIINSGSKSKQSYSFRYCDDYGNEVECCLEYTVDKDGHMTDIYEPSAKFSNGDTTFADYFKICNALDVKLGI